MAKKKSAQRIVNQRIESQITPIPTPAPVYGGPNMITLSSDMTTIYLIDGGRAIPYSLNAIGGVLVGEVKGQITVVSALEPIPMEDKPTDGKSMEKSVARAAGIPVVKSAKIPTSKGNWNFIHLRERRQLCIIGAVDLEGSLTSSNTLTAEAYIFDLREGFINIQKIGATIVFETVTIGS